MDMNQYQRLASRTMGKGWEHNDYIKHALFGLASEVGEIHGIYQKKYQGHLIDKQHVEKEIGDVLWFIAELCTALNVHLSDVAEMNIDKLLKRYPEGFSAEKSLHRVDGDI